MDIHLDGRHWRTKADLIEAVIAGMRGPSWHGRNYDALHDSMVTGSINALEPPYHFVITPPASPTAEINEAIAYFMDCIAEWRAEGADLSVRVAP